MTGDVKISEIKQVPVCMECTSIFDTTKRYVPMKNEAMLTIKLTSFDANETIKLDDTMMKRIAKYNTEIELRKVEEKIKSQERKLKKIEEKIEDREQRWKKIQDFVSDIYELPLEDEDDDYNYDWED